MKHRGYHTTPSHHTVAGSHTIIPHAFFLADRMMDLIHIYNVLCSAIKGMTVSVHTETQMVVTHRTWPHDGPYHTEYIGTFEELTNSEVTCSFYGSDYVHKKCDVLVLPNAKNTCTIDLMKRRHWKTQIVLNTIVGVLAVLWCISTSLSLSLSLSGQGSPSSTTRLWDQFYRLRVTGTTMAVCSVHTQTTHTCLYHSNEHGPVHCGLSGSACHATATECETSHCIGSACDAHRAGYEQGHNHCAPSTSIGVYECSQYTTHSSVPPNASTGGPVGTDASKLQRQGVKFSFGPWCWCRFHPQTYQEMDVVPFEDRWSHCDGPEEEPIV